MSGLNFFKKRCGNNAHSISIPCISVVTGPFSSYFTSKVLERPNRDLSKIGPLSERGKENGKDRGGGQNKGGVTQTE